MRGRGTRDRDNSASRRRLTRRGIIAGLTVFLMLAGAGVSYAAWTSSANTTSSASAANLAISTGGFSSNAFTFQNHRLTTTGYVTATNSTDTPSSTPGTLELSFGYTGSSVLAGGLTVAVWPIASTASCTAAATVPSGAVTGRWDTVATTASPITASLAKNATLNYCVRVTAAERGDLASTAGALTIQPSVSATLKVGNWKKTSTASTTTQQTAWIFPAFSPTPNTWYQVRNQNTSRCLDVFGANDPDGTGVIDYPCKTDTGSASYNQHWKFTRTTGNYFTMTPRHSTGTRLDVVGQSTAASAAIDIQNASSTHVSQEWQVQTRSAGVYQIVNRRSGMCLQPLDTTRYSPEIEFAQVACDGSALQSYSFIQIAVDVPSITLTCGSPSGGGVTLSWTGAAIDTYQFQSAPTSSSTWSNVGNAPLGATSIVVAPASVSGGTGQYTIRAMWLTNQIGSVSVWKTSAGALSCSAPGPSIDSLTCVNTGTTGTSRLVQLSWTPAASQQYSAQYRAAGANGAWTQIGTIAAGATSWSWPSGSLPGSNGTYDVRIVAGTGTGQNISALATTSVIRDADSISSYLRCAPPAPTLQCTESGAYGQVSYVFSPAHSSQYILKVLVGSTWQDLDNGTVRNGNETASITSSFALGLSDGTYSVQARSSSGTILGYSTVRHATAGGWYDYLRCS